MKKRILTGGIGLLCSIASIGQNDIDAMRYSQITFGGTARFASMGGSMGALGGDISTLSFNPAGIAVFRKTEISITPSVYSATTISDYRNSSSSDNKLNFNLGNIGLVTTYRLRDTTSGWQSLNFGIGYNRTNNFHNRIDVKAADNTENSLLDLYVNNANGHYSDHFDGFSTGLAWTTYLFNPIAPDSNYYYHVISNYGETQHKSTETKGAMGEGVFSFGGNYKEKLLIGATLGVVKARYEESSTYEETDDHDTIPGFKSFKYVQSIASNGTGVNFKLGMIVKPNDWLRLGAAFHTPTVIRFTDNYSSYMLSDLDTISHADTSKDGSFKYSVTTPFRAIGSVGFIIKKIALINVEYEYLDYSYASLNSHPNEFSAVNATIRSKYTTAGNIRAGAEIRLDPIAIRVGYALYGSPFRNGDNVSAARSSYTGGIGYRVNSFFIDFAYVHMNYDETSYLYDPAFSTPVKNNFRNSSFMLTLGARF